MRQIFGKFLLLVSLAALVATAVWWSRESARRTARRESWQHLVKENAALDTEIKALEQRIALANQKKTEAQNALAKVEDRRKAQAARSMYQLIANDPVLQNLELKRQYAASHTAFARFFEARGLPMAQRSAFIANYAAYAERDMDLTMAQPADGPADEAVNTLKAQNKTAYEKKQLELLGEENFRAWQEYQSRIPAYDVVVRGLAGTAALEGCPITTTQAEQLISATIAAARDRDNPDRYQSLKSVDWNLVNAAARDILTPEQFTLFTTRIPLSRSQTRAQFEIEAVVASSLKTDPLIQPPVEGRNGSTPRSTTATTP
jgi:cell division protein FtsB